MYMAGFFTTAPQSPSSPVVAESYALLDALHISYERIAHDPADTPEVCDAVREKLNLPICKNLFLCNRQKTAFYLVTMYEDKPFSAKEVGHQIGSSRLPACWVWPMTQRSRSPLSWIGRFMNPRYSPATPAATTAVCG